MRCRAVRKVLAADYCDGEIEGAAREDIERHLGGCAACRAHWLALRRAAVEPFRDAPPLAAPAPLWERVRERIGGGEAMALPAHPVHGRRLPFRLPGFAYAAASAAAAVLIAAFLIRQPLAARGGARTPPVNESEELHEYLQEQLALLASDGNGIPGSGEKTNGEDGSRPASSSYGTIVEEYLM